MVGRNLYEVAPAHGRAARRRAPGRCRPRDARPGHRRAGRRRLRRGERAARTARAWYRNRYAGRTFIQPSQSMRQRGVKIKLNPLREVVAGKRLVVVDDSIVRGTTTQADRRPAAAGRRRRGPRPHQRAADLPPVLLRHRHLGRDRAHRGDAHRDRRSATSSAPIRSATCPSAGVLAALDLPYERFCFACFDGNYPEPVPYDAASRKFMLEEAGRRARG